MKCPAVCLLVALAWGHGCAMAQATGDPMDRLRACSTLASAERMKCLDLLSRAAGPDSERPRRASGSEGAAPTQGWVISETTSPVDYSPVVVATASGAVDGLGMKLTIACRSGTTSVTLGSQGTLPAGDTYSVSYAIDGEAHRPLATVSAPSATGMVLGGDVVGLLMSFPVQGELLFRISGRQDVTVEGRYSLADLKITRERMAVPCKWSSKPDRPRKG